MLTIIALVITVVCVALKVYILRTDPSHPHYNGPRWIVRTNRAPMYGCTTHRIHYCVIDTQTMTQVPFDCYHQKEIAMEMASIYNRQGGPSC